MLKNAEAGAPTLLVAFGAFWDWSEALEFTPALYSGNPICLSRAAEPLLRKACALRQKEYKIMNNGVPTYYPAWQRRDAVTMGEAECCLDFTDDGGSDLGSVVMVIAWHPEQVQPPRCWRTLRDQLIRFAARADAARIVNKCVARAYGDGISRRHSINIDDLKRKRACERQGGLRPYPYDPHWSEKLNKSSANRA